MDSKKLLPPYFIHFQQQQQKNQELKKNQNALKTKEVKFDILYVFITKKNDLKI